MLRFLAILFSVLFHPLLIVTYMTVLLLLINPYQFGVYTIREQGKLVLLIFLSTFAMPLVAVVMMRSLNMLKSIDLEDRQDRIIPYVITGIFYLWMVVNFKNNPSIPKPLTIAFLGATIGLFGTFFVNNFTKISAHASGMGGLVGMAAVNTMFFNFGTFTVNLWPLAAYEVSTNFLFMAAIVMSGVVCTSRLYLEAHTPKQIYLGFGIGLVAQFMALLFMG